MNEDLVSIPWFESKLANNILKNKNNITDDYRKKAKFFIDNGYLIIKNSINEKFINILVNDFKRIINSNKYKKNPKYFHYNSSPRIIEGWKQSKYIKKLCFQSKVTSFLNFIYGKKPVPVSTINFLRGTEQPLHSDYIHFGTLPELYLAGAWYALENVDDTNGPLIICPKSHKLGLIDFTDLNLKIPRSTNELKTNYTVYEKYLKKVIKDKKLKTKKIHLKKGDVLIWSANLLHGGSKIKIKNKTRLSQVIHYHFKNLRKIYNPCFSSRSNGIFAERNIKSITVK
ncbi:phytanoyl-CoA dioxygenase family protein [Candidatus Pelagibacter sp.]|nr:phytanoyl-CoA dioxygenase family protein [Candidatus Pelagibacter sp.]